MSISEIMEEVLRSHRTRMKEIDDNARDQAQLLGAENVRNILCGGDASASEEHKIGAERIDRLVAAVSGGKKNATDA